MSCDDQKDDSPLSPETTDRIKEQILASVGYGRPPVETRFQPGRSGNPKGRPRSVPPDTSITEQPVLMTVERAAGKSVRVREGDRISEVTMREALVQAVFSNALKGNARSQGLAIDLVRQTDEARAREVKESNRLWTEYKEVMSQRLEQAKRRGETVEALPHPDDIVIDPEKGPRFLGPVERAEEERMSETIRYCEALIMQDVHDHRSQKHAGDEAVTEPGSAMLLLYLLQRSIPPRLRWSDMEIASRWMRYDCWPMRRLLKELFRAWKSLGRAMPRGAVMPSQRAVRRRLSLYVDLMVEFNAGRIDVDALASGEVCETTRSILAEHGVPVG